MDPPFKTGDKVRLKTGKSAIIVMEVDFFERSPYWAKGNSGSRYHRQVPKAQWYIRFAYRSSLYFKEHRKWREAEDFVYFDEQPKKEETIMTKPTLYQTNNSGRFGTFLTKNSAGHFVLEMKGEGGKVEAFPEKDLEIVTPFTVEITQLGLNGTKGQTANHIITKKGQVAKDDVLLELNSGHLWRVTLVNSKCLSPRDNKSKWLKIPAELITLGE